MLGVRLEKETEDRLDRLAKATHRTKSFYVKEAIKLYLDEISDYEIALSRLRDNADKILSSKEMRKRLGI